MIFGFAATTVVVGIAATVVKPCHRRFRGYGWQAKRDEIIYDLLSGVAIVPFGVIALSVFQPSLVEHVKDDPVLLAVAGIIGLIYVIADLIKKPPPPPSAN